MKKLLLLVVLVGSVLMLQAQRLEKTDLMIEKFKSVIGKRLNSAVIQGLGSDESNYYVYYGMMGARGKFDASFFVIDKKLTTAKEFPLTKDKEDRFVWVQATEDDLIILLARDKDQKTQIVKQLYAKKTGQLKKETSIASFSKSKSDNWYFYSSTSPDKTKKCFMFMLANKNNSVDSYYAAVLNQDCEMEWNAIHELTISNEVFNMEDIAVNNKGDMYLAFYSQPKDRKKSSDKNSYIDLVHLSDGSKDKMNFQIGEEYYSGQIRLKILKNNDLYMAGIFSQILSKNFFSIKIDGSNFSVLGEYRQSFREFKSVAGEKYSQPTNAENMKVNSIFELNNGDIAVLCERTTNRVEVMNGAVCGYTKERGDITTFFIRKDDASIDNTNIMEKKQLSMSSVECSAQALHLSVFPFIYGDKIGFIFNDCLKKYATPAKYKGESFRKNPSGDDVCIVLNIQEKGEKDQLTVLTGSSLPAKRLVREILFQEDNRLIVLTRNKNEAYIETLTLP